MAPIVHSAARPNPWHMFLNMRTLDVYIVDDLGIRFPGPGRSRRRYTALVCRFVVHSSRQDSECSLNPNLGLLHLRGMMQAADSGIRVDGKPFNDKAVIDVF